MAIPGESEYIYGFHDPGNWRRIFTEKGRTAWVLVTEGIGHNPNEHSSPDYREWSTAGFGVIVRLNHGYSPDGTLPVSGLYDDFARRCANHVADSQGAHIWIIGNEMNHANEQPGVRFEGGSFSADELITPDKYAACFKKVRAAIKSAPGHANDQVVLGAVAPYTAVIRYPGNEEASWTKYFTDILKLIGAGLDGIALHAYTHGADPNLIFDEAQPWPQFPGAHYHFRAYRDFMRVIPGALRSLPIYLTETDQSDDGQGHLLPWADTNSGWVRNAYSEINAWNATPGNQQIRCLLLYRWSRADDWYIEGRRGVIDDMKQAVDFGYKWNPAVTIRPFVTANNDVYVRSGPGTHFGRIGLITQGSAHPLAGRNEDSSWLQISYPDASSRGWISAQFVTLAGDIGSVSIVSAPPPDRLAATTRNDLNIRSGAGTQFERIGTLAAGTTVEILGRTAGNAWLQIAYPDANSRGWIAAQFADVSGNLADAPVVGAPPPTAPARPVATISNILNVRSGPGTQYPPTGLIYPGTQLDILGRSADRTWLQIAYPDANSRGWISAQFVTLAGDIGS
ncbi:MAG TPA: SH3 domain-containing protein, partial [Anaerolineae bacterium]|nr:SH3 domain-containing protein [Anaerolineae bacterium]